MFVKKFFKGGAKVPHFKNTANSETIKMPPQKKVTIPMLQHIGAPCEPLVKRGDIVKVGQIIGDSDSFISAPIHSSVSGTVTGISSILHPGGFYIKTVDIESDGKQEICEGIGPPKYSNTEEFTQLIRKSGLVGLGGAGFPASVKLSPPKGKKIDTLIINAAECEPFITSDYREIIENLDYIMDGINLVCGALDIENVIVGIEDNKPEAIENMMNATSGRKGIKIAKLKSRYPQGAEKMLIYAVTKRKVPAGRLPSDVGVIVMNVNSISFISKYMKTGIPLIEKRVTVDGAVVKNPSNVRVLIGTPLGRVFDFCGGFYDSPKKVLMGGPMMGIAQFSLDLPVVKHTNALLAFGEKDAVIPESGACIRCGRCVTACPMNLMPLYLNNNAIKADIEGLQKYHINDCMECGSCSYVCPAKINLVQSIRLGKLRVKQAAPVKGGK